MMHAALRRPSSHLRVNAEVWGAVGEHVGVFLIQEAAKDVLQAGVTGVDKLARGGLPSSPGRGWTRGRGREALEGGAGGGRRDKAEATAKPPGPALPSRPAVPRTLRREGCSVGDAAVQALATGLCPHLEILSLRRCPRVSGAGAGAALHGCRALRQLLLGGSGVADCAAAPAPPRPSQFSLVELPARAARHVLRWQALLAPLGAPKLVYAD